MYAIVVCGGKQYKVAEGDIIEVEKLEANIGDKIEVPVILKVDSSKVTTENKIKSSVTAEVVSQHRGKKITVFTYKPKKNERKKKGHRQYFSKIKVLKIN